jgi:DNA-binding phage protein
MTLDEFIEYLYDLVARAGSQRQLARQLGISTHVLNDTLNNHRPPESKLLSALGFSLVITYTYKPPMITYKPPVAPRDQRLTPLMMRA